MLPLLSFALSLCDGFIFDDKTEFYNAVDLTIFSVRCPLLIVVTFFIRFESLFVFTSI